MQISTRMVSQRSGSIKINNTVEHEDGKKVTFTGELTGTELDYVLQVGLNYLMYHNLIPSVTVEVPKEGELH